MKITDIKVLHGPNYWSIKRKNLILLKIDTENLHEANAEELKKRLKAIYPWFEITNTFSSAEIIAELAIQLQTQAGMSSSFYEVDLNPEQERKSTIVFEYMYEEAGIFAAKAAVDILIALMEERKEYPYQEELKILEEIRQDHYEGLSTGAVVEEARKRGIPHMRSHDDTLIVFGYGKNQKRIRATITSRTPFLAVDVTDDKDRTKRILKEFAVSIPEGVIIYEEKEMDEAIKQVAFPLVVKPLDGNHGRGITVDIRTKQDAVEAFRLAQQISKEVIVEKYITGFDYRLLVINYKFIGAVKRVPPFVTGNGTSTIEALIEDLNRDPRREDRPGNVLKKIEMDEITVNLLKKRGLTLQSVLKAGETVYVKEAGNVSAGAVPADVTDEIHPYNVFQAERIARLIGLDICGIDVISPDMTVPFNTNGSAVVEVNAAPGIRMHMEPAEGTPRNAAAAIIDMLFPPGSKATIPITAIAGSQGKAITARLLSALAKAANLHAGTLIKDTFCVNEFPIQKPAKADRNKILELLKEPLIDLAVIAYPEQSIYDSGLAFEHCDTGIITNLLPQHQLEDITNPHDMGRLFSVVVKSISPSGHAIINADDELLVSSILNDRIPGTLALFSIQAFNPRIEEHCKNGGLAVVLKQQDITLLKGNEEIRLGSIDNIPLVKSNVPFAVQSVLIAALYGYIHQYEPGTIRRVIREFQPEMVYA